MGMKFGPVKEAIKDFLILFIQSLAKFLPWISGLRTAGIPQEKTFSCYPYNPLQAKYP